MSLSGKQFIWQRRQSLHSSAAAVPFIPLLQIHAIEGDLFVAAEPGSDRTAVGGVLPLIQQHLAFPQDLFIVHFGLWHGETQQEAYKK